MTLIELKENPGEHGTFMNLLRMAQIDLDRIEYMDPDQRVAYFEKASNIISRKLSTIWGFHEGRLEIRYEQGKSPLLLVMITPEESRVFLELYKSHTVFQPVICRKVNKSWNFF